MDRTLLPPDFVRSDPDWLYSMHEIPVPQKFFYLQLRGLAWGKDCTPWLRIDQLEELTGKKASVIWGYMSALRTSHCLLWQTAKGRGFMFTFTDKKDNSEKSELLRKIGNASSTTSLINNDIESKKKEERAAPKNRSTPKVRSELPTSPREAAEHSDIRVFMRAATFKGSSYFPGDKQYRTVIETIQLLRDKYRVDDVQLADLLRPYYVAWRESTREDGKPYEMSSLIWLTEWALNERMPKSKIAAASAEQSQAEYEADRLRARERMQKARQQLGGRTI